jgi:YD repeat-containing protein
MAALPLLLSPRRPFTSLSNRLARSVRDTLRFRTAVPQFRENVAAVAVFLLPLPVLLLARPPAHHRGVAAPLNVVVTPKDSALTVMIGTNSSVVFEVSNTGSVDSAFTLSCTPSGRIISCTPQTDLLPLAGHTAEAVTVTYAASGTPGPGTLMLTAVAHNVSVPRDSGSYDFTVVGPTPTLTQPRQNDSVFNRGHCLTTDHGPFTWSCGAAMVMLSTPGITTLDKVRAMTLGYVSTTVDPHPLIAANVTMPASGSPYTIDRIRAVLTVDDTVRRSVTYTPWSSGTKQIVLAWDASQRNTGAYYYALTVYSVIGTDSTSASISGITTVVNRRNGNYGNGWEWTGIERIIGNQPAGTENMLWVGGDGSTALFHNDAPHHWVAARDGFVDTLSYSTTDTVFTLTGKYGVKVTFDATGRHVVTTNRQGQTTKFYWRTFDALDSIQLAPLSAHKSISLHYSDTRFHVDTVRVGNRRVALTWMPKDSVAGLADSTLRRFAWEDGTSVVMVYDTITRQLQTITDDRGAVSSLLYDATGQVIEMTQHYINDAGHSDSSKVQIHPWQSVGFATSTTGQVPGDTAKAFTAILGPRNVGDSAEFHIDKWGAPVAIFDADHQTTRYIRGDANAPGEVSEIDFPDGRRRIKMAYDSFANLIALMDTSLISSTTPGWFPTQHSSWAYAGPYEYSSPTSVTTPDGTTTSFRYNAMGLTDSVTDPHHHLTTYAYATSGDSILGQLLSVTEHRVPTWVDSLQANRDTDLVTYLNYDRLGNSVRVQDPAGGLTKYVRDTIMGLVTRTNNPVGTQWAFVHDTMERVTQRQLIDSLGDTSSVGCSTAEFSCDPRIRGAGDSVRSPFTTQAFYSHGLLTGINDPRGVRHRYVYDLRGLVVADSDEAGHIDSTVYDHAGLVTKSITRDGYALTFDYDAAGREVLAAEPSRASVYFRRAGIHPDSYLVVTPHRNIVSTYDVMGNLLVHTDSLTTITRTYLDNGSVASETSTAGFADQVSYVYDQGGRIVRQGWARGDSVQYIYDPTTGDLDSLRAVWRVSGGYGRMAFGYGYDSAGPP